MSDDAVPEGMMEVFTVERPKGSKVLIDDLKLTREEAEAEVKRRGRPWRSVRVVVPYRASE